MQKRHQHGHRSGVRNTDFLLLIHIRYIYVSREYYACKSIIKKLLLLFSAEKCIEILKCKATGQLKIIIIIIEIKRLFQCAGQDRQQQPTVTHSIHTKHTKNKQLKQSAGGKGDIRYHTTLFLSRALKFILRPYQYRKTFREAQGAE